jgi:hypothetical protein
VKLIDYLRLKELLKDYKLNRQEEREFALKYKGLINSPVKLLKLWIEKSLYKLGERDKELLKFIQILNSGEFVAILIAFLLGFSAGIGLLSYSGEEPINIIYFLLFSLCLPIISGILTILSILGANSHKEYKLLYSSPGFLIEKIFSRFFGKNLNVEVSPSILPPKIVNWRLLELSIKFSISFYVSLSVALLLMVIGEDMAFGWRSTLNLSSEEFFSIIKIISLPWSFWSEAVPSKELIKYSHYYRLGGLDPNFIKNASLLGEWWRFLFMTIVVYGIVMRILLLIVVKVGLRKALRDSAFEIEKVNRIVNNMTIPFVSTRTDIEENPLTYSNLPKLKSKREKERREERRVAENVEHFKNIVGWSMSLSQIELMCEKVKLHGSIYRAGGECTIDEDMETVDLIDVEVLILVKSWEIPTMDFIDFLEELDSKGVKIYLFFVGLESKNFLVDDRDKKIWQEKILSCNLQVEIKDG